MKAGKGGGPFIIAEAGVNHNGRLDLALRLVKAAAAAGADAVKFQTFDAEALATAAAPKADYQKRTTGAGQSQLDMLRGLQLDMKAHRELKKACARERILFLSTPFDEGSADLLVSLGMPVLKLASGEVTNLPLLRHVGGKELPVILSTGMSTLEEVSAAVNALAAAGCPELTLLHCVSNYPAAPEDANLRAMATLAEAFGLPVGFSDHTPGFEVSVAAAALGAAVIEKHFTLDKSLPGPDHAMSLCPEELKGFVSAVRNAAASLGDGVKAPRPSEAGVRAVARRSLALRRAAPAGTTLTEALLCAKRPGTGISPMRLGEAVGRKLKRALPADALLAWEDLA